MCRQSNFRRSCVQFRRCLRVHVIAHGRHYSPQSSLRHQRVFAAARGSAPSAPAHAPAPSHAARPWHSCQMDRQPSLSSSSAFLMIPALSNGKTRCPRPCPTPALPLSLSHGRRRLDPIETQTKRSGVQCAVCSVWVAAVAAIQATCDRSRCGNSRPPPKAYRIRRHPSGMQALVPPAVCDLVRP